MFSFLDNYIIEEYKFDDKNFSLISKNGKQISLKILGKEVDLENKKKEYPLLDNFVKIIKTKDSKEMISYIKDLDCHFFSISLPKSDGFFITEKYDRDDSIFAMYISKNIYESSVNMNAFVSSYRKYCVEVLKKKQILIEVNNYMKTNETLMNKNNFEVSLYNFKKTRKEFTKILYIDSHINKIYLDKKRNKLRYSNCEDEVNLSKLIKMTINFFKEDDEKDICGIVNNNDPDYLKEENIQNYLMDFITGNRNKRIDYNVFVYLEENTHDILGFSFGYIDDEYKLGGINTLFVEEKNRNKGISRKLQEAHEIFFRDNGIINEEINTLGGNQKAKEIYTKAFGFHINRILYCYNV